MIYDAMIAPVAFARKVRLGSVVLLAALLVSIFWADSFGEKTTFVPLLDGVSPKDSVAFTRLLSVKGIKEISYDDMNQLLLVSPAQRASAYAVLAMNYVLPKSAICLFDEAVYPKPFDHFTFEGEMRLTAALEREVARMLENVDGIEEAEVVYTLRERKPLFRAPRLLRASVMVKLKADYSLSAHLGDGIITLVTFARKGLDEVHVVAVGQGGWQYRKENFPRALSLLPTYELLRYMSGRRALAGRVELLPLLPFVIPDRMQISLGAGRGRDGERGADCRH